MQKRLLFYELKKHLGHKNALVITGMRQVGKTTLMRQIYEEVATPKLWFDLDNPLDQKIFESINYAGIYQSLKIMAGSGDHRLTIFVDEAQNWPEITKIIKYFIDHYQSKFIVTGSSSFYLKNLFPESLSGRKFLYELPPIRFREFLYFREFISAHEARQADFVKIPARSSEVEFYRRESLYREYLQYGGFPEVVHTPDKNTKQLVLKNIFASFFEKDLRTLSDYKDIREFRDLILLLVPRVGSMLDISKLASELGVERAKIYGLLDFLQGTFFIHLLPKFSRSVDRSVAGGRKIYFGDTGLLNIIGQVNAGQLLENAVINQLLDYGKCSFYNHRNVSEIDAILDNKTALEIKLAGSASQLDKLAGLASKLKLSQVYIISQKYVQHPQILSPVFI